MIKPKQNLILIKLLPLARQVITKLSGFVASGNKGCKGVVKLCNNPTGGYPELYYPNLNSYNMDKQKTKNNDDKENPDASLYKYHKSQMNEDKEHGEDYPEKPKNHTTTDERLISPDRGKSN